MGQGHNNYSGNETLNTVIYLRRRVLRKRGPNFSHGTNDRGASLGIAFWETTSGAGTGRRTRPFLPRVGAKGGNWAA